MSNKKEEFITKANAVHNNKYDYSKVDYINTVTKVTIICPEHGEFKQDPYSHLSVKTGCPKCAIEFRAKKFSLTKEKFSEKANTIHGKQYNYDKVIYVNNHTKVTIGCSEHGEFEQTPNSHLSGQGCPVCGGKLRSSTEEFIAKSKIVHGDLYDYSKVDYVTAKTQVIITCKKHGDFFQIPNNHLQGMGCPSCMKRVIVNTREFIERAKATHGDKYNYSKANYVDSKTNIVIGCKIHGEFEQAASEHIRGRGCIKCANELSRSVTEDFINKAKLVHGDLYNYSKTVYITSITPLIIECKKHGVFKQRPSNHLSGYGCPVCKASKGELVIAKVLKKHNIEYIQEYTIPNQDYRFRYDFYVPSYNLFIEFHGQQHYEPIEFFGGKEGFLNTKLRDGLKRVLAKSLGYKLIEVKYTYLLNLSEEEFERKLLFNLNRFN